MFDLDLEHNNHLSQAPVKVFDQGLHLEDSNLLIPIKVKHSKQVCHDLFWVSAHQHLEDVHELHEVDVIVAVGVVQPEEVTLQL